MWVVSRVIQYENILDEARMEHKSFISFYKFPVTTRLERYIREINAAQSKAIILKNDLFNDFELEEFEERYVDSLRERDDYTRNDEYVDERYFTKLCDDINDVIEANDKLLAHLYVINVHTQVFQYETLVVDLASNLAEN